MIIAKRLIFLFALLTACNTGNLKVIADLPVSLNEVSGITLDKTSDLIWMVNDSGNKPILYGVDTLGNIRKSFKIKAKNRDWEDLTMDDKGHLYIGNFGNNDNDSKGLSILKIHADSLVSNQKKIKPEIIAFTYPEQKKFPPKKSKRHFDCEAFFYFKDSLYLFTKSRAPKTPGITKIYKLPTKKGTYKAEYVNTFNTCKDDDCWVTSADISDSGDKLALLTENSVFMFSELNTDDFFASNVKQYKFDYKSQKESVAFKNDTTLYIADEYLGNNGGNLYEFPID